MNTIDLLIEARWVIPVAPANQTLENHAIAIDNGIIIDVLPQTEARQRYRPREQQTLSTHAIIPGLVNLHTHAAMTLMRGLADDLPLMDWLQKHIWPAEKKHVSPKFVYDGTRIACREMLKGGTTCFNDMYFFPDSAAKAVLDSGMRAAIGLTVFDFPTNYGTDAEDYLTKGLAIYDEFKHEKQLSFCLAPHAPYTVSDSTFLKTLALAEQCNLPIHTHLHETTHEIEESIRLHHCTPIQRLHKLGLLSPNLIAVHSVHLSTADIDLLATHNCSIAHCPTSNLKLASGIPNKIHSAIEQGINVGIGTDGAASNNRLDMLSEMRLAALLAKGSTGLANTISANHALYLATLGGAKALGLDEKIGSITRGKFADLCAIDLDDIALSPCYNPISHIAYTAGREHVSAVWVSGKCLINNAKQPCKEDFELKKLATLWQNLVCPRQA